MNKERLKELRNNFTHMNNDELRDFYYKFICQRKRNCEENKPFSNEVDNIYQDYLEVFAEKEDKNRAFAMSIMEKHMLQEIARRWVQGDVLKKRFKRIEKIMKEHKEWTYLEKLTCKHMHIEGKPISKIAKVLDKCESSIKDFLETELTLMETIKIIMSKRYLN